MSVSVITHFLADNRVAAYNPLEPNRKSFSAMSTPAGRSPLGPLSSLSATLHHSPLHSPALYNPYSIVQPLYHGHHNQPGLSSFPIYGMNQLQHINAQELQKIQNPYAMVRNANYNKRSPEDANRYADVALETLIGDIYSLCKDQHGCRYLQKKLDERNSVSVDLIFAETYSHAAELMIGIPRTTSSGLYAKYSRSLWELPLSKASRAFRRPKTTEDRANSSTGSGQYLSQHARYTCDSEND